MPTPTREVVEKTLMEFSGIDWDYWNEEERRAHVKDYVNRIMRFVRRDVRQAREAARKAVVR